MKKIYLAILCTFFLSNSATAGFFDDLTESAKAKQIARVDLPLSAIKGSDARVYKIEGLAIEVAMKKRLTLKLHCPAGKYCNRVKSDLDKKAWKIARAKTSSDYAARGKLLKIKVYAGKSYYLTLWSKGI